jgi:hypothetical protein
MAFPHLFFFILFSFSSLSSFLSPSTEAFGERARAKSLNLIPGLHLGFFCLFGLVWFGSVWLGLLFDWLWLID